jgi:hypothetical protein
MHACGAFALHAFISMYSQLGDLPDVARVLVGTMSDLSNQRQVTTQQVLHQCVLHT